MRLTHLSRLAAVVAVALTTACEAKKSSNPLSPTVAGPIPGVEITAPKLLEPAQGFKFKESQQPIKLLIENAATTGVRPISYVFEVGSDDAFATKVFARSGVAPGEGGRTSVLIDKLPEGRPYYWRARAEDGANTGPFAAAQFEVLPKPQLDPPVPIAPINNDRVTVQRPQFHFMNSARNVSVGAVQYEIQIARDQAFAQLADGGFAAESGTQTTFVGGTNLDYDLTYYWRARATDGETVSAWTAVQVFRSMNKPSAPSPPPSPSPGAPCVSSSAQTIVECQRAKYGHMSSSETVAFLRAVARDLNTNRISGGPFGILRKDGGSSCGGYSCDVICSGQGTGQKQWDVLGDAEGAQTPGWAGPKTYPDIRIDVCEIQ